MKDGRAERIQFHKFRKVLKEINDTIMKKKLKLLLLRLSKNQKLNV